MVDDGEIDVAATALREGGIVGIPTDTIYGLAVAWGDPVALQKLFDLKGRDHSKPVAVLVGSRESAERLGEFDDRARGLADRLWPGPLTLVVPTSPEMAIAVRSSEGTIGVRWPASDVVERLTTRCGPLIVTSANRSGRPPAATAEELAAEFGGEVEHVIDGGPCGDTASTVVLVDAGEVRILRAGDVGHDAIDAALAALP